MSWFRKPDVEVTVEVNKVKKSKYTAADALTGMNLFTNLCMANDLSIVKTEGTFITVKGRPKNVARFQSRFDLLSAGGWV